MFTASTIALKWLSSKTTNFLKVEKKGAIINKALDRIVNVTNACPMSFHHVDGNKNQADCVTRSISINLLAKSNFFRILQY